MNWLPATEQEWWGLALLVAIIILIAGDYGHDDRD